MRSTLLFATLFACPKKVDPVVVADPLDAAMPEDAGVRAGVYANGMKWYVEVNREPQARAVLRLVVDAGSVLEDPDQLGLAHFVEHMAFNGTTHFPGNEMVQYLEGVGTRFGPHLNAHTSFDETVYKLMVPTDDPAVFEKAFLVLEDWAHGLTFAPEEIEKERGVVLEEWRTRLGAQGRIFDQTVPFTFFGSTYAERLPIGTSESLQTFEHDALKRFYADWYHPGRMAVVAVGDFDPDQVAALLEKHFATIPVDDSPRPRTIYPIPDHDDTKIVVVADPEVTRVGLSLLAKHDDVNVPTHRAYRESLLEQVAFQMINERLGELTQQPNPPFLGAGAGVQRLSPTEGGSVLSLSVAEGGIDRGYEAVLTELKRVHSHGFQAGELQRAQARVLKTFDTLLLEKDKTDSVTHATEIIRHFTSNESMPGTAYEVELARRYVPAFTLADFDAWSVDWMPARSRVLTVVMPQKEGLAVPTEAELRAIEARVDAATVDPLPPDEASGPLLATLPTGGTVASRDAAYAADLGFDGLVLSNGVKVWMRRTDFKADEIRFTAYSKGGSSRVAEADVVSAEVMIEAMNRSGYGAHDANGLDRWAAGKSVGLSLGLSETAETLSGETAPSDLEAELQMIYAALTAPKLSDEGWARMLEQRSAALGNRDADPNALFQDTWVRTVWPDDPRRQPWTLATLDEAKLDRSRALMAERFGAAGDWVFVFVGNLPEDFEAQVARYLGALPSGTPETSTDRGVKPASGKVEATARKGLEQKARVRMQWHGDFPENTWDTRNQLFGLGSVLNTLLREKLREELGGVYGVGVNASEDFEPASRYAVTVEFTCDPQRVAELVTATEKVIADLQARGPDERIVEQEKEKNRRSRQENLRTNNFWLSSFGNALQRSADPKQILTWDARNDALTPALIQTAAKTWLKETQRAKVVLLPEE